MCFTKGGWFQKATARPRQHHSYGYAPCGTYTCCALVLRRPVLADPNFRSCYHRQAASLMGLLTSISLCGSLLIYQDHLPCSSAFDSKVEYACPCVCSRGSSQRNVCFKTSGEVLKGFDRPGGAWSLLRGAGTPSRAEPQPCTVHLRVQAPRPPHSAPHPIGIYSSLSRKWG